MNDTVGKANLALLMRAFAISLEALAKITDGECNGTERETAREAIAKCRNISEVLLREPLTSAGHGSVRG